MLFFTFGEIQKEDGISKKILFEFKSLKKFNSKIKLISHKVEKDKISRIIYEKNICFEQVYNNKISRQLLCYKFRKILKYIIDMDIEVVYIRYEQMANPAFLYFLKKLKKNNKKIILEIPTYPYDGEKVNDKGLKKIKNYIEEKYRYRLHKYVDRVVTFSDDNEIFKIKTIKINNGIDLEEVSVINRNKRKNKNEINFIGVAGLAFYHGYDRLIKSMKNYYNEEHSIKVIFHIVGVGDENIFNELKILAKNYDIEDKIIFYGKKFGKELNEIYEKADIGIGSLGIHRIGLKKAQPLKNREYTAKGLPFIVAFEDPAFFNKKFVYQCSGDEELIDIKKIIEWYENNNFESKEIRKEAENFSWDAQMKKIIEEIKKI